MHPLTRLRPPPTTWRRAFSTFRSQRFMNRFRGKSVPDGNQIDKAYYRVRLQKPPVFTAKNVTRKLVRLVPLLVIAYYILPVSIQFVDEDSEKEAMAEDGSLELDEDDDEYDVELGSGIFLPLSWPKEMPRQFYRATDPEWQEYVKLSKNKDRQRRIFEQLIQFVRNSFNDHPKIKHILGTTDVSKGRHWIDVVFAKGPPKSYEQLGIEISTEYIALVTREISQTENASLSRYFDPSAVMTSLMATCSELWRIVSDKAKTLTDANDNQPTNQPGKSISQRAPIGFINMPPLAPKDAAAKSSTAPTRKSDSADSESSQGIPGLPELPGSGPGGAQEKLMSTFFSTFRTKQAIELPRGCILLTGLIECKGTRANATVDVTAAYDLFENRFVHLSSRIRRIVEHKQKPQGGH